MLYSQLFGKTVKTAPSGSQTVSNNLLYRGGFIRQVSAGRYAFLPLGYRVVEKLEKLIDEEMLALGSQRIETPIFHPIEIWQATNRDKAFGGEMHIIEDHHGATFAIGATAEGLMVELTKNFNISYKDLPFYIHQFIGKFRDEKRPKGGLMRVREFVMKDAYSFDKSEEDLNKTYQLFFNSYLRIAERLGLEVIPVLSDSGAIGGDYNHEFLVKSEVGEAEAFICNSCGYAAQIERAESGFEKHKQDSKMKEVKEFRDDEVVSCEILAEKMGVPIHTTTKTILFETDKGFVAAMIRGDYDINETKLKNHLGAETIELAAAEDVLRLTGSKVGFVGPIGLPEEVRVVADLTCADRVNFEAGGNETGLHLYNLNYERDLPTPEFIDIREVEDRDPCIECGKKLEKFEGIEFGHCFKLDKFYSKPQNATFTKEDGSSEAYWMGSYGIGLGRAMATVVETHNDENGIIWPEEIAPYKVHLVGLNLDDEKVMRRATDVYEKLLDAGVDILFDNRLNVSAGEKFADADLVGCPYRIVISAKTGDSLEIKKRGEEKPDKKTLEDVLKFLGD